MFPNQVNEDCSNLQRCMNMRVYLNLLEPDSIMKDGKDYSFAMKPKYECEELLSHASDKNGELSHREATIDEKKILSAINSLNVSQ